MVLCVVAEKNKLSDRMLAVLRLKNAGAKLDKTNNDDTATRTDLVGRSQRLIALWRRPVTSQLFSNA